ncbi:MAG: MFS transporter [Acidimicrobiales bacterium]|jgi:MFS family permease|nr:MFS transporter [Acidimicrobiales bacterium]MDP6286342.1 MFS transporter [Acidimicrobiales bacterium]MDP6911747.1 MFS transporter [Acidimicrobiales bacterium]HJP25330.1 MFS transporter [Acidimicrobiales bacterium]
MDDHADHADTGEPPPGRWLSRTRERIRRRPDYRRLVLITALFGTAAGSYPVTVLSASLPHIARDLGTTDDIITWVIAAPMLAFAVITPIIGKIGDLYGHRRTYLVSFSLGTVLALATSLAWGITSLIVLRTLAQAAKAASGPSAMAMILSVFPQRDRTRALGIWAAVVALSPAVGVVTGGPLVEWLGWRILFVVQGLTVGLALLAALLVAPETPRRSGIRFDVPGAITLGIGVSGLLLAVNRGISWGWTNPIVLVAAMTAPVSLGLFVAVENRSNAPLLPPALLRRRAFTRPMTSQAVLQSGYMGAMVMAPFLLERRWGFRPTVIGLVMLPRPLSFALCARLGGHHDPKHGARRVTVTGMLVFAFAMVLAGVGAQQRWLPMFLSGAMLAGAGSGYIRPTVANSVTAAAGDADIGIAGGSMNMLQQIGAAVGITVLTALMADSLSGTRFLLLHLAAAGAGLVAAWLALGIEDTPAGSDPTHPRQL